MKADKADKEDSFICQDCEREIDLELSSEFGRSFPDKLCQDCMRDLIHGNWHKKTFCKNSIKPKNKYQDELDEIFGEEKEERDKRNGSSLANIVFIKKERQRRKKIV